MRTTFREKCKKARNIFELKRVYRELRNLNLPENIFNLALTEGLELFCCRKNIKFVKFFLNRKVKVDNMSMIGAAGNYEILGLLVERGGNWQIFSDMSHIESKADAIKYLTLAAI